MTKCRICGNEDGNNMFLVKEMMYGDQGQFEYFQCSSCRCLQILEIPHDLSIYYPQGYYSYNIKQENIVTRFVRKSRTKSALGHFNIIGYFLNKIRKEAFYTEWFKNTGIDYNSKIIDIGCGNGSLLNSMSQMGFKSLTGIDPFINNDIINNNGVKILKKNILEIEDSYDLIMLHHSFEHMVNSFEVLEKLYSCLNKNGFLLIRIPVISKFWEIYSTNWYTLDAPRHIYLHSVDSMRILADKCNFSIKKIIYDSNYSRMLYSEQYKLGISYYHKESYLYNKGLFSSTQIKQFKSNVRMLNLQQNSDCAAFYLQKNE